VRVCGRGLLTRHGPRPFLLYGQGRLGSTLLGSLLSSHPQVTFGNEVLRGPVRAPGLYLQGLRARAGDRHYGCHVKPYHLTDFQGIDDPARWLRARHRAGWLVVHLQRRNTLLHVLSNVTRNAMTRSHFQQGDGQQVPRIAVDTAELLTWMQHRSAGAEAERLALVGLPVQEVVYEDDLLPGPETWAAVTARLFAALDLAPCPVDTSLRKINPRRLEDFVANADEVRAAVAASRFADCVADA
jgi:LPS sulfotransferase NodH